MHKLVNPIRHKEELAKLWKESTAYKKKTDFVSGIKRIA